MSVALGKSPSGPSSDRVTIAMGASSTPTTDPPESRSANQPKTAIGMKTANAVTAAINRARAGARS
jgi:hypothetical protein